MHDIKIGHIYKYNSRLHKNNYMTGLIVDINEIFYSYKILTLGGPRLISIYDIDNINEISRNIFIKEKWELQGKICGRCDTYFGYLETVPYTLQINDFLCYQCQINDIYCRDIQYKIGSMYHSLNDLNSII